MLISSTLDFNEGVSEMIRGKGMVPGAKNIRIEKIESNKKMANTLNIETGDPVYLVKRLRTANDVPVAPPPPPPYTEDYMPAKVVPNELFERLGDGSLYEVLEGGLGIELTSSILKLSPMTATKALAKELGIKQGDLLISLKQTDTSKDRMPILYSEEYFIPNRFEFVVMRKRKKNITVLYGRPKLDTGDPDRHLSVTGAKTRLRNLTTARRLFSFRVDTVALAGFRENQVARSDNRFRETIDRYRISGLDKRNRPL